MTKPAHPNDPITPLVAAFADLRVAYDRFIGGLDRAEPLTQRNAMRGMLRQIMARPPTNTAQAFRLQTLRSQMLTFETYWDRMVKHMEAGTLPRMQRPTLPAEAVLPPKTAAAQTSLSSPAVAPVSSTVQALHTDYMQAAKAAGMATPLPLKDFAAMVDKHIAGIQTRTGWKEVTLRVALENGRPTLRAKEGV